MLEQGGEAGGELLEWLGLGGDGVLATREVLVGEGKGGDIVGEEQCSSHSLSINCWSAGLTRGTPIIGSRIGDAMVLCLSWSEMSHSCGVVVHVVWGGGAPLFNNVRTTTVRCGHLGLDGQLVKQLQQGVAHGHLAVPPATLDNELQPNNMPMMCFSMFIRCEIVEPVDA